MSNFKDTIKKQFKDPDEWAAQRDPVVRNLTPAPEAAGKPPVKKVVQAKDAVPELAKKKVTFNCPAELHRWFKIHSAMTDVDIQECITQALENYREKVERPKKKGAA